MVNAIMVVGLKNKRWKDYHDFDCRDGLIPSSVHDKPKHPFWCFMELPFYYISFCFCGIIASIGHIIDAFLQK